MVCPHCNRTIREEERYSMSSDPDSPGLFGFLSGDAGPGWRIFVTIAVCTLAVLLLTGLMVAVRHFSG